MRAISSDYYRKNYLRMLDQNEKLEVKLSELGWFVCGCGELHQNGEDGSCKSCIRIDEENHLRRERDE